jgi:hypothetical protein
MAVCKAVPEDAISNSEETYPQAPDLQEWTAKYGSYSDIPWAEWDAAIANWQIERRMFTAGDVIEPKQGDG